VSGDSFVTALSALYWNFYGIYAIYTTGGSKSIPT